MTLLTLLACTSTPHLVDPREPIRLSLSDRLAAPDTREAPAEPSIEADAAGVRLAHGGSQLRVRTTAWGRGDRATPLMAPPLDTGARLELRAPGLTEWWERADQGWEQGWIVQARPGGAGELTLQIHVVTPVHVTADQVDLGWGPTAWRVDGLSATDATGLALPVRFVTAAGGFAVAVDDRRATYPLNIDPVYTTPNAELNTGNITYDKIHVDGAGDVNGDGYDDVVVRANYQTDIFLGGPDGVSTTRSVTVSNEGSVAGAGDVNGDGYGDLVFGYPGVEPDPYYGDSGYDGYYGEVGVHYGSAAGISPDAGTLLQGEAIGYSFGYSVDGAGDVNGDGYDDVVIDGPSAYVYLGSADGLTDVHTAVPPGWQVAGVGDLNGDGYGDIAVLIVDIFVYFGSADGVTATNRVILPGLDCSYNDSYSAVVAGAGDLNGDGFDDLVTGNEDYGEDYNGGIEVYFGSAGSMTGAQGVQIDADEPRGAFGAAVGSGGDLDGDGYDELLAADPFSDNNGNTAGQVRIYAGTASGVSCGRAWAIDGSEQESLGWSVASAGDVNADGLGDIIVGNYGRSYAGDDYAYPDALVYLGRPSTDADATGICDTGPFDTDNPADDSTAGTGESKSGCGGCASTGQLHPGALLAVCSVLLGRRRARRVRRGVRP